MGSERENGYGEKTEFSHKMLPETLDFQRECERSVKFLKKSRKNLANDVVFGSDLIEVLSSLVEFYG
jgi:hypothetical protein